MHQVATAYSLDPAVLLGIDPLSDPWFAWQVRRAVYRFGSWFDARRQETKEVPMPETKRKPMQTVPKYGESELMAMLGLGGKGESAIMQADPELDGCAAELQAAYQRGDVDWRTMLG